MSEKNICFAVEIKDFNPIDFPECKMLIKRIKDSHRRYPNSVYRIYYSIRCQCGLNATYFNINESSKVKSCPKCGTEDVVTLDKLIKSRMFSSTIALEENTDETLKLSMQRNKVFVKKDGSLEIKNVGVDYIFYDKPTNNIYVIDYREKKINSSTSPNITQWIKRMEIDEEFIVEKISRDNEDLKYLNFLCEEVFYHYEKNRLQRILNTYYNFTLVEKLYKTGFSRDFIGDVGRNNHHINSKEKKLHKIFNLTKNGINILKHSSYYSSYNISQIRVIEGKFNGNDIKEILKIYEEETIKYSSSLTDFLSYVNRLIPFYNNKKALVSYLCRRVKLEQGLDNPVESARLLYDYINTMQALGFDDEIEKYPKSLKKVHDIAVMNRNALNGYEETGFEDVIAEEDYVKLEKKDKIFSVIAPKTPEDVIKEGRNLSHCVASYVKDIAKGLCKILFLRLSNNPDESYMTIEVRGNEIKQFKGLSNREATEFDKEFLRKWAEEKELRVVGY